jgi:hypothetical protein
VLPTDPEGLARHYRIHKSSFDPVAFLPSALEVGRARGPGATFAGVVTENARDDGTVDLALGKANYFFAEPNERCHTVWVSGAGIGYVNLDLDCEMAPVRLPRCVMAKAIASARAELAGRLEAQSKELTVAFRAAVGDGAPAWMVSSTAACSSTASTTTAPAGPVGAELDARARAPHSPQTSAERPTQRSPMQASGLRQARPRRWHAAPSPSASTPPRVRSVKRAGTPSAHARS